MDMIDKCGLDELQTDLGINLTNAFLAASDLDESTLKDELLKSIKTAQSCVEENDLPWASVFTNNAWNIARQLPVEPDAAQRNAVKSQLRMSRIRLAGLAACGAWSV